MQSYTLTSADLDLLLIALRHQQNTSRECAELSLAIGYPDAAQAFEQENDHAEGLVSVFQRSDKVDIWLD